MVMHRGTMVRRFHLKLTAFLIAMGVLLACLPSNPALAGQARPAITL